MDFNLYLQSLHTTQILLQEDEDENQEAEEEFREGKLQWAGGRKEEATYDAGDNEDAAIAASARRQAEAASGNAEVTEFAHERATVRALLKAVAAVRRGPPSRGWAVCPEGLPSGYA